VTSMRTHRARAIAASLVVAVTLAAAGCGGGGGGTAASVPESADLVPASVPVFLSFSADFQSEQWQAARALLGRFPGGSEVLADYPESVGQKATVALLELDPSASDPPIMLVAKPDDPQAFERDLAMSDDRPVWRVLDGGWYVVAGDEPTLDRVIREAQAAPLSADETFRASIEALPTESLGLVYVDGEEVGDALASGIDQTVSGLDQGEYLPIVADELYGGTELESVGLALTAEAGGVRVDGVVRTTGELPVAGFSPRLAALVPEDALVYAAFGDVRTSIEALLAAASAQDPDLEAELAQAQLAAGVSLEQDVFPLFAGENALFVQPGVPTPVVTVVLSPEDPQRALATLDKLVAAAPVLAKSSGHEAPFTVSEMTIAGVPAKQLVFTDGDTPLIYAAVGDNLVLSTAATGIADVVAGGGSIADDPEFRAATEAAGVGGEVTGLLYVDLTGITELAALFSEDVPFDLESIRPLRSVVLATSSESPQEHRFHGFLAIGE
jgi:Protein of unknown function (DUF3352)